MLWGEPPPLWQFQGEERQSCLDGCTWGPSVAPWLAMPEAETSSLGHLQVSRLQPQL